MKIAVFKNFVYPEYPGGTTTYLRDFCQELARDHQVTVFTCTRKKELAGTRTEEGVTISRLYIRRGSLGLLRFRDKRRYLKTFLDRLDQFDILNVQGAMFLPLNVFQKYRDKIVITCHASLSQEIRYALKRHRSYYRARPWLYVRERVKSIYAGFLERRKFQWAAGIITMSEYVKAYLLELYPQIEPRKVTAIPIGGDFNRFKPSGDKPGLRKQYGLPQDAVVFLTIRRLVPRMGLSVLLRGIRMALDTAGTPDNTLFLIGGAGPLKDELERQVRDQDLGGQVRLLGFIPDEDILHYYQMADCFILPTEELEGFGIVTLEALASGLAVIGTDAGATPEILADFQQNLIAKAGSAESIAGKIRLYLEKYHGKELGNRKIAAERYDWSRIITSYIDLFNRVIRDAA